MASEDLQSEPMTREEAKRILRRLELDAYSSIVTAFRAQGDISRSKKSILGELSSQLSISTERHRAEVRRVVNDDRLNAVAECMYGSGTSAEWSFEGRRLVSLMPRLVPQTVFTAKATAAANQAVESNQKLPIKTEIEVVPLPTKQKSVPKNEQPIDAIKEEPKDVVNSAKVDDKTKKKKKLVPCTKPSSIALNKTLTNPFKTSPSMLKPIIKSTPLKSTTNFPVIKTSPAPSPSNTNAKYSPKPIIVQKSPTKIQQASILCSNMHVQCGNTSTVTSSLTTLNSLVSCKGEGSLHGTQSPMIKVVSNSLSSTLNPTSVNSGPQSSNITQKIKFKTPLPKPKVKATKFKPMVPLQRTGILCSSQGSDALAMGSPSSSSTATPSMSPVKSSPCMQGMSVKVVQVAKSGISGPLVSSSLMNYSNKPVVVVPSSSKTPPSHKVLSFNSISGMPSQSSKIPANNFHSPVPVTSALQKGTLPSKSMPLATGFKMIAVTTVVPGTTQVKTVYIATPIMSLTKNITQAASSVITTPATQNKHSSLTSNLQSVVARSMNAAMLNQTGKYGVQNMFRTPTVASSITTPTFAVGKSSNVTSQVAKGLRSLSTTLAGSAQSLKVFTAVSKNSSPLCLNNSDRNTPFLSTTNIVKSQNLQRVSNIQVNSIDSSIMPKNEKRHVVSISHQGVYSNSVGTASNNSTLEQSTSHATPHTISHITSQASLPVPSATTTRIISPASSHTSQTTSRIPSQATSHTSSQESSPVPSSQKSILHLPLQVCSSAQSQLNSHVQSQISSHVQSQIISHIHSQMSSHMPSLQVSSHILSKTSSQIPSETNLTMNSYNNVSNTLNVLNNETIITEQITASAVGESNDIAFLSAGEKFLEQLSAKMCVNSPDGLSKNEKFILPGNTTIDSNNENLSSNTTSCEFNKNNKFIGLVCSSNTTNAIIDNKIISNKINSSQAKHLPTTQKRDNYILNPRIISRNIDIVSSKINSQLLNNNLCFMTSKLNSNVNIVSSISAEATLNKSVALVSSSTSPFVVSVCRTTTQPSKTDPSSRTVLYPCMSKETTKADTSSEDVRHSVIISTQETTTSAMYDQIVSSLSLNNKLPSNLSHKPLPVNSKLNISSFHSNNGSPSSVQLGNSNLLINSEQFNPVKSGMNNSLLSLNNFQKSVSIGSLSSAHTSLNNDKSNYLFTSIKQTVSELPANQTASESSQITHIEVAGNGMKDLTVGKKRKFNELQQSEFSKSVFETAVTARTQASWIRGAANLLARVSRFRGSNKQKGEMNAASWFTKPVDPSDAPGYYRVIRRPMDFGKIRRKLEDGEYLGYPNFYDDMMLVRENCYAYNPSGHSARKDCDEVFSFFEGEYEKLRQRWEKHYVSPHKKTKIKMEENGNPT